MGRTAHRIPAELLTAAQIMVGGTAVDALYIGNTQVFGGGGGGTPSYLTGGVVTDVGGYRYHTFNTSGTLTFVDGDGPVPAEYIVIAGGGGGSFVSYGNNHAGGGGAGGTLIGSMPVSGPQTIVVGAGGPAPAEGWLNRNGSPSSLGAITTVGGGGGGNPPYVGGSGGGASGQIAPLPGAAGTAGQGNAGGNLTVSYQGAGGGGGKGTAGLDSTATKGGNGGAGIEWPAGGGTFYAGGGGGVSIGGAGGTVGGVGGGGRGGAYSPTISGMPGTPNTGGGGGGFGVITEAAVGGSGKVIVRYPKKDGMPASPIPSDITGLVGWYDASDAATLTSAAGKVSQWADKSGGGRHLTQGTAGRQPTTGAATIGGRNALRFTEVDWTNMASASTLNVTGPVTLLAVAKSAVIPSARRRMVGFGAGGSAIQIVNSNIWSLVVASVEIGGGAVNVNPHAFVGEFNGASSKLLVDNTQVLTGDPGSHLVSGVPLIVGSAGSGWQGEIGEWFVYNRILTAAERDGITSYLLTKWGITP